ncbi:MAG: hypothetical protein RSC75_00420 [Bacteroidales bacterium]
MAILALICTSVNAQDMNPSNNGNTPYSRYGYGRLAETSFVRNRGMGGIGYGLRSNLQTNPMNPASYTAIDSLTFLFDFGVNGQLVNYKENGARQNKWNGGLDYLAMQFPLSKHLAASIGLLPYSYVGYGYGAVDSTATTDTSDERIRYIKQYAGNGGLNKVYVGLGGKPFKWVSLGVNVGYIFGEISNDFSVTFPDNNGTATYSYQTVSARALELQFGVQFMHTFNVKHAVTLGATFSPKMNMWADASYIQTTTASDTTKTNNVLSIPQTLGIGASYVYDNRLTIGADVKMEKWGDVAGLNDQLEKKDNLFRNTTKIAVGAEYLPSLSSRSYLSRMRYRAGMHYSDSYIEVKDSRNKELGFTLGLGFPLKNQKSMVNVAFEYIDVRPQNKSFLSENYLQLNIGLTFNEFWFFKNKLK